MTWLRRIVQRSLPEPSMPSASIPVDNENFFTSPDTSNDYGPPPALAEGGSGTDSSAEILLDLDEMETLGGIEDHMMHRFMQQSNVFNTTGDYDKLFHCFEEYVNSFTVKTHDPTACPVKFDGVSCWPETSPGRIRTIPCFSDFNGVSYDPSENNATRYCYPNGTWANKAIYDFCLNVAANSNASSDTTVWAKSTIFYVGNSLSLVAVTLALWIFISFKDLRCLRNTIHTNLLFTYLLHSLFWIVYASIQTLVNESVGCSFFVVLSYFFLTNFMWMFVEGLYLYMLVVKTFETENIKLRVYTLIGWGVPLPIIIAWVLIKTLMSLPHTGADLHVDGMEDSDMEGLWTNGCPLMVVQQVDWIQKAAVLFLLSANIIFLARIMWVLITKLRSANNVETQRYRKATKAMLVLIPLLGLTYMLLIILPKELEHMQAILLSTQGFWVAVFFCFLNSEVQNSIRHHIERWKTERGLIDPRSASVRHSRDGSKRSKFECFSKSRGAYRDKGESLCTDVTTMSTIVINGCNNANNSSAINQSQFRSVEAIHLPSISPQSSRRISKVSQLSPWGDQDLRTPVKDSVI